MDDHQVDPAVVVQVARRHAPAHDLPARSRARPTVAATSSNRPRPRSRKSNGSLGHRAVGPGPVVDVPVGDEQVELAVVVDVEGRVAETRSWAGSGRRGPRQGRVQEQAAAEVAEEGARLVDEVREEQVDAAVAVEVVGHDAHARRGPARAVGGDPRRDADLLEPQSAQVAEQEVGRGVVGDEDVELAVVVEVGDGQAQAAAARAREPGRPADLGERAVAVVAEEQVVPARDSGPGGQWIGLPDVVAALECVVAVRSRRR